MQKRNEQSNPREFIGERPDFLWDRRDEGPRTADDGREELLIEDLADLAMACCED